MLMEPIILDDMVFSVRCHEARLKVIPGSRHQHIINFLEVNIGHHITTKAMDALRFQIRATYGNKSLQAVFKITYSASMVPLWSCNLSLELRVYQRRGHPKAKIKITQPFLLDVWWGL